MSIEISFSLMVTVKVFTLWHSALDWRISIPSFWISQYDIIYIMNLILKFSCKFQHFISILYFNSECKFWISISDVRKSHSKKTYKWEWRRKYLLFWSCLLRCLHSYQSLYHIFRLAFRVDYEIEVNFLIRSLNLIFFMTCL